MVHLLHQYFKNRSAIKDATLEYIGNHFKKKETKRNELLLSPGQICRHYYFVNKGCLRLFTVNTLGVEGTRYFAFEGAFGTALPSLIEQQPAFEFIQTIEKSELLAISREDFYHLVDTVPEMAFIYRQILETAFISAQKRIYGFQGLDALGKVQWVMNYNPALLTRVSNKMAASFLGLTPATLSRLKSKL
jgi:CRP-like cAMP-binding protein